MILVKVFGGLGNQLFQYSAAKSLSMKHDVQLVLDLSWFKSKNKSNTVRTYSLENFGINARIATPDEESFHSLNYPGFRNIFRKKTTGWTYYSEKKFGFSDDFFTLPDNTYLNGYWQSYKFFESIKPILMAELEYKGYVNSEVNKLSLDLSSLNSVAIHVRRGDYVSNLRANKFHGTCPIDYYLKSINLLREKVNNPEFFVFSDDIDWVRNNMDFDCKVNYIDLNYPNEAHCDFFLMGKCKHFIIANSTYSWWPAWLSSNSKKIVIAPKNWFAKSIDTKSLFPGQWVLL